jgi:NAD(P)H-hydrate repair Nnr-like enzyme with NAD(P)H-hydrate dehydratase domain
MSEGEAEAFKVFEAEGWSAQAGTYDCLTGAITSRLAESLLDAADVRPHWRVLDVATGPRVRRWARSSTGGEGGGRRPR